MDVICARCRFWSASEGYAGWFEQTILTCCTWTHRATMDGWVLQIGELLIPVTAAMRQELMSSAYLQADETPVPVQMEDGRGKHHQAYLWQYGSPGETMVFDFRLGRGRDGPSTISPILPRHPANRRLRRVRSCGRRWRRADYHRKKLETDSLYRQVMRDSHRQWWDEHPDKPPVAGGKAKEQTEVGNEDSNGAGSKLFLSRSLPWGVSNQIPAAEVLGPELYTRA
jgi:hypothetical protein